MQQKFYDVHYHLVDLSHANILSFLSLDGLITKRLVKDVLRKMPFALKFLPLGVAELFPGKIAKRSEEYIRKDAKNIRNLLSVIEGATEFHFLYNDYYLRRTELFGNGPSSRFRKLVITPLLMDFGYKDLDNRDLFYNHPPAKPILNQVVDMFNAIWFYYNYDLILHPTKLYRLKLVKSSTPKEEKLFEIYPFLGINTQNYGLDDIKEMFGKYFAGYENDTPEERQKLLFAKSGTIKFDMEELIFGKGGGEVADYTYLFAGIKLYPPLGFDPWPGEDQAELDKVIFLYSECAKKRLPITVHCSEGGFVASPDAKRLTDPRLGWSMVLKNPEFKDLKLNFAHFGSQGRGKREWRDGIVGQMRGNRNVYSDCSCRTPKKEDYRLVNEMFGSGIGDGLLFGSDFLINLLWSPSYNDYLCNFLETPYLTEEQKMAMCATNPERFLFG